MSRSNPTEHLTNPATRWFEWNGEAGTVRYYDKEAKKNIDVALPFTFMLLDQLSSVRGWHDASSSGIYSNEVKDTRQEAMLVKAFKGGTLAEGVYRDIKDRVNTLGGQFNANCYLAFKNGGSALALGMIRFKGSALGAWMEFCKAHKGSLYSDAITIKSYTEGKKGRIVFRVPVFSVAAVSEETNKQATALDTQLQTFLTAYLKRRTSERTDTPVDADQPPPDYEGPPPDHDVMDDDIPF